MPKDEAEATLRAPDANLAPIRRAHQVPTWPLRRVPLRALLAGVGLALVGAVAVTTVLLRSDRSPELSSAELDDARLAGADALTALARRFPDQPEVLLALAVDLARDQKDFAGAVRALRHLLEVTPGKWADEEVQGALIAVANGPPEVAADAFEILRTRMAAVGPDILFDLALSPTSSKYATEHATAALSDPEAMKNASKALLVADELRRRLPCGRKAMIERAMAEGDGRSIPFCGLSRRGSARAVSSAPSLARSACLASRSQTRSRSATRST